MLVVDRGCDREEEEEEEDALRGLREDTLDGGVLNRET